MSLQQLKTDILEDGIIDSDEVVALKAAIYEDGVIDTEEAAVLFELADATEGNENDSSWDDLFVEALSDYVLADENTPGVVDPAEAAFLISHIEGDGIISDLERKLLANIKAKAVSIDMSLMVKMQEWGI